MIRAEIENVAIAMYESNARRRTQLGLWPEPWHRIDKSVRSDWRAKAEEMLKEPLPC